MAKLYFYYSSMNAGKTTTLLQSSHNYRERGMNTLLLAPLLDNRYEVGQITSRIGLTAPAQTFDTTTDLFDLIQQTDSVECVMVDEAQFLTRDQVLQLCRVCDEMDISVLTFGLRTDFTGGPFEGSQYLLALADNLHEIKAICRCGRKATMVLRLDSAGEVIRSGDQVAIGGNERYVSVCRQHFMAAFHNGRDPDS